MMGWTREEMAQRATEEIRDGLIVNLGIGIPTLCANFLQDRDVVLHSENGLLGMGPFPYEGDEDPQIINAGKQTVTIDEGGSTFDSALSFAMIRGGHVDLAILGAMQVDVGGDLANWQVPGKKVTGMGGAMDLVSGAKRVVCLMTHTDKAGGSKLVKQCTLPITGVSCVSRVITDLAVIDVVKSEPDQPQASHFRLVELAPGISRDELEDKTGAPLC
jgi:3-oxoacid CoA-transferase subunit B